MNAHVPNRQDQYVVIVVAVAEGGVIGADGGMPWHLPEDLAHFKRATMGTVMVMGRLTFESIGRPLPGRRSVVITRDENWTHPGAERAGGLEDALRIAGPGRVSLIGGGQIFEEALAPDSPVRVNEMIVTHVHAAPAGDTFFPPIDPRVWRAAERREGTGCEYVTYRRISSAG